MYKKDHIWILGSIILIILDFPIHERVFPITMFP